MYDKIQITSIIFQNNKGGRTKKQLKLCKVFHALNTQAGMLSYVLHSNDKRAIDDFQISLQHFSVYFSKLLTIAQQSDFVRAVLYVPLIILKT